jgi:hypothetical protein
MERIPDTARVAPGANYTGWRLWLDAALAGTLDKIINSPSTNPASSNSTSFAGMCGMAELVHGGHITAAEALDEVRRAMKQRHDIQDKEIDRQWRNAFKRTADKPRLYQPQLNGTVPTNPTSTDDELKAGYHLQSGRLVLIEYKADGEQVVKPLADIGAQLTTVATTEDGQKIYTLNGKGWRSGKFSLEITAEEFESDVKLRAALGARCPLDPIYPRMSQHLPAAVKTVTPALSYTQRFHRTGWRDNGQFLIPGLEPDGVEICIPNDLPYNVTGGDLAHGLAALDNLLSAIDDKLTTVVMASLFAAPLLHKLGLRNRRFGMFLVGRTGSLKTSWLTTAMSIYGAGHVQDEQYVKWGQGSTANAMMKLAALAQDMPLMIDNYKPNTGGGARAFVQIMHGIIEGGEKKRLNRNSELRDSADIYTLPVFTGEALPGLDAAALARFVPVEFPWGGGAVNEQLAAAQLEAHHLPAVGRVWLQWLEQADLTQFLNHYEEERRVWADWLMEHQREMQNKLRVASNIAIIAVCWRVLCHAPDGLGELARRYTAKLRMGLVLSSEMLNTSTDNALEASRFISGISQMVATGRAIIADIDEEVTGTDKDRLIGWREGEVTYLLPDLAVATYRRQMDDRLNEFDTNGIGQQLAAMEHLLKVSKGRNKLLKRVRGARHWVWCVKSSLIWDESVEAGDGVREPGAALGLA